MEEKIREVMNTYADACYRGDLEKLKKCFHKDATMSGYLGDEFITGGPNGFFEDIAGHPSMESTGTAYTYEIRQILASEKSAVAVLQERGFFGECNFVDYMSLVFEGGEWKIISKVFETIS